MPTLGVALGENGLADRLTDDLIEAGFENVSVILEESRAIVTYENRIYRDEIRAIKEVMALLAPQVEGIERITLIPQNRKILLVAITIPATEYPTFVDEGASDEALADVIDVSLDVDGIWRKSQTIPKTNSSFHKFDVVVHPQFNAQFGNYDDSVESQINLMPELRTTLWKGMSLSAQLILPLQNDLGGNGDELRPGRLTINQTLRLPHQTFASATMGYFTRNRYGADLEIKKYFANGRWSLGANLGYTGFAEYQKRVWYYSNLGVLTTLFSAEYRVSRFDLSLRATYEKFLYGDRGWRLDILRQFGEVDIGFFTLKTEKGSDGGFNFSIPIFPPKYLPTRRIRISPAQAFPWEYRYRGLPRGGRRYNTGNRIDAFLKRLNPDYIKNQIAETEDWR